MSMDVGSIIATLSLDASQFHREVALAIAELRALTGEDIKVDVKSDDLPQLSARAREAAKAEGVLDDEVKKTGESAKTTHGQMSLMMTAILGLGPALVPLAAGATALGVGFGGMGAAGLLAFKGIKAEMAAGTAEGLAYQAGLDQVHAALSGLEATAARNIFGPFQVAVRDITAQLPSFNGDVAVLTSTLGVAGDQVVHGILSALHALSPVMTAVGVETVSLAGHFAAFTSGSGFQSFVSYMLAELPQVVQTVESVGTAALHLVAAFAGVGGGTLAVIRTLADLINAIPVGVLQVLAPVATATFIGFRSWQAAVPIVSALVSGLQKLPGALLATADAERVAEAAAGPIGVALAALSLIVPALTSSNDDLVVSEDDLTAALIRSHGVIDENIRQQVAQKLATDGLLDSAKSLGLSLPLVTSAALGQTDALAQLVPQLQKIVSENQLADTGWKSGISVSNDRAQAAQKLIGVLTDQSNTIHKSIQDQKNIAAASQQSTAAANTQTSALSLQAAAMHTTVGALQSAMAAQKSQTASAAAATAQMQLENNAAGLLKAALDALNGKALSAAEAQNQLDSSLVNMTKATGRAHSAITGMSQASVQARGALDQQVQAAFGVAQAHGALSGSSVKARAELASLKAQVIANAVAHGYDRDQVQSYIDKIFKIPRSVPPTRLDVNNAAALAGINAVKGDLGSIPRYISVAITTRAANIASAIASIKGNRYGGIEHFQRGGIESFIGGGIRETAFQSFADGKLPSQAMIAPDGANLVQWAEHGTGGEAFIPLGSSNHARSVAIWEETGRRLGVQPQQGDGTVRLHPHDMAQIIAGVREGTAEGSARGTAAGMDKAATSAIVAARSRYGVNRP